MLFTNNDRTLIEVKRCDFKNDTDYYRSIIRAKDLFIASNVSNADDRVLRVLKTKLKPRTNND